MPAKRKAEEILVDKPSKQARISRSTSKEASQTVSKPPTAVSRPRTKRRRGDSQVIEIASSPLPTSTHPTVSVSSTAITKREPPKQPQARCGSTAVRQNLDILRKGVIKRSSTNTDEPSHMSVIRDHYDRMSAYTKRRDAMLAHETLWDTALITCASGAARDSVLGILDTIVREFVIYWFPEVIDFITSEPFHDQSKERKSYKLLADGLVENLYIPASRLQCHTVNEFELRKALNTEIARCLRKLYDICQNILESGEKRKFDPQNHMGRPQQHKDLDTIPQARILDSTVAWDLEDTDCSEMETKINPSRCQTPSRPFFIPDYTSMVDASDSGQVWGASPPVNKNFEFSFRPSVDSTAYETLMKADAKSVELRLRKHDDGASTLRGLDRDSHTEHRETDSGHRGFHVPGAFCDR